MDDLLGLSGEQRASRHSNGAGCNLHRPLTGAAVEAAAEDEQNQKRQRPGFSQAPTERRETGLD